MIIQLLKKIPWDNNYVQGFGFVIGLIASCLAIFTFVTGWASLPQLFDLVFGGGRPPQAPTIPLHTPGPMTPLSPTNEPAAIDDCAFLDTLLLNGMVMNVLEEPPGSRQVAGLEVFVNTPVQVPPDWQVHGEGQGETSPVELTPGEIVSVWAPANCHCSARAVL